MLSRVCECELRLRVVGNVGSAKADNMMLLLSNSRDGNRLMRRWSRLGQARNGWAGPSFPLGRWSACRIPSTLSVFQDAPFKGLSSIADVCFHDRLEQGNSQRPSRCSNAYHMFYTRRHVLKSVHNY